MGTRNLTMIYSGGEMRVAQYCHWDGHLNGAGIHILRQLRRIDHNVLKSKVDVLEKISQEEVESYLRKMNALKDSEGSSWWALDQAEDLKEHFFEISRDCGPEIITLIANDKVKAVRLNTDFAGDSLYCEWAYVIDLDKGTLEIYSGFNQRPLTQDDRFYYLQKPNTEWNPVKIIGMYKLDSLPDDETFLSTGNNFKIPFERVG